MGFEYVDHTADVAVRAWASSPSRLFTEAARALFGVMVRCDRIVAREQFEMHLSERTLEALLVEWLAQLLAQKELTRRVFARFETAITPSDAGWHLEGWAWGESLDPGRHLAGPEVKGISPVALRVWEDGGGWHAQFVLDV